LSVVEFHPPGLDASFDLHAFRLALGPYQRLSMVQGVPPSLDTSLHLHSHPPFSPCRDTVRAAPHTPLVARGAWRWRLLRIPREAKAGPRLRKRGNPCPCRRFRCPRRSVLAHNGAIIMAPGASKGPDLGPAKRRLWSAATGVSDGPVPLTASAP